jgi:hypothetical protein
MYRGGVDCSQQLVSELGPNADRLSKTLAKIKIDRIRGDVHQSACTKRRLEMFDAPLVRFVCFLSAHGRLGIALQVEIRPLPESQGLALSYDFKDILSPFLRWQ